MEITLLNTEFLVLSEANHQVVPTLVKITVLEKKYSLCTAVKAGRYSAVSNGAGSSRRKSFRRPAAS